LTLDINVLPPLDKVSRSLHWAVAVSLFVIKNIHTKFISYSNIPDPTLSSSFFFSFFFWEEHSSSSPWAVVYGIKEERLVNIIKDKYFLLFFLVGPNSSPFTWMTSWAPKPGKPSLQFIIIIIIINIIIIIIIIITCYLFSFFWGDWH
jgi:uncharacterized membrane protein